MSYTAALRMNIFSALSLLFGENSRSEEWWYMDISESYTLHAPREQVWDTLLAPDTLRRCVPGCESLEQTGDDSYAVRLNVTIDEIQGVYDGTLHLLDVRKPEMYRMVVDSAGARGDLHSNATLRLEAKDADTTVIHCSGQAWLGGAIASVDAEAEAADGAANKLVRQYFDQLAELLPDTSAGTTAQEAPATTATSLPFALAEAARTPRRRNTTSRKPKVQQTAPIAAQIEQAEQAEQQDEPQTSTATEPPRASSRATPRRRSGNSGKAQQRNGKAKDAKYAEVAQVAEIADTQATPDSQDNQPPSEAAVPPLVQSADISGRVVTMHMEQAPSSEQPVRILDVAPPTPPTPLDRSLPTVEIEAAGPNTTPSRAIDQTDATSTSATTTTQRRFEWATIVDRSALGSYDGERGPTVANVLGIFIAVTAIALAVLIVTLAVGSLH